MGKTPYHGTNDPSNFPLDYTITTPIDRLTSFKIPPGPLVLALTPVRSRVGRTVAYAVSPPLPWTRLQQQAKRIRRQQKDRVKEGISSGELAELFEGLMLYVTIYWHVL